MTPANGMCAGSGHMTSDTLKSDVSWVGIGEKLGEGQELVLSGGRVWLLFEWRADSIQTGRHSEKH